PFILVPRLFLDLPDEPGAVVAQRVLELLQQDLARLAGAQTGDALELTNVLLLRLLELVRLDLEVAGAVVERALLAAHLRKLQVERLLLAEEPLLDAGQLGAAGVELGLRLVVPGAGRAPGGRLHRAGGRRAESYCGGARPAGHQRDHS